jgi:hypothetical protein
MKKDKYKLLRKGIFYDLVGVATYFIPVAGPFIDLIWAPYAARKMTQMYSGNRGKIAAVIVFLEELLPLDLIPTFTLMWLFTFVLAPKREFETVLEVSPS